MWGWAREFVYLDVIVGVPVRVVDDDCVSGGEINAQTTSSGREEESKLGSTGSCWDEQHEKNSMEKENYNIVDVVSRW